MEKPGESKRVVIITSAASQEPAGYIADLVRPSDTLICADGGAVVALQLGLVPHLVVGDLDSIDPETEARVRRMCPVRSFPVRKDKTDTHLALDVARDRDPPPGEVVICGAFGDRIDHNVGLILLLAGLDPAAGPAVRLVGARQEAVIAAGPGRVEIDGAPGDTVSLLPLTPRAEGITTGGLGYPLDNGTLTWGSTLGVSNEMTSGRAAVSLKTGRLLVVHLQGAW